MVKKYQLANGMKVIFYPTHKAPVVAVQVWVNTGSADERKGEEGISHFIEHLVFKGTEKYGVGEIANTVEAAGGNLNAYTTYDRTVFYISLSKHFADVAFDGLSQMMGSPKFDPVEIDNEREVVIEEIKRSLDNPQHIASQAMFAQVYKKHSYGIPIIGYEKIIRSISPKKLKQYYQDRYTPKNMTLVIVGDLEDKQAKALAQKYFASFKVSKLRKVVRKKEPVQTKARFQINKFDSKENLLNISWPIPNIKHKDIPALDLLSMVLGSGESSRLHENIRNQHEAVNWIYASAYTPKDQGLFSIGAGLQEEKIPKCLNLIQEQLERVLKGDIQKEEIAKAILNLENHEFFSMESVDGIASNVGQYLHLFEDDKYFNKYLKQIKSLSTLDLQKVAKKYLKPEAMNISCLSSKESKLELEKFQLWHKSYKGTYLQNKKLVKAVKAKFAKIDTSKSAHAQKQIHETLSNGIEILVIPAKDSPTMSIVSGNLAGLRIEDKHNMGISNLLSRVWDSSALNMPEQEFKNYLDSNALYLSSFSGYNSMGLKISALSYKADQAIEVLSACLKNPSFSHATLLREKESVIQSIQNRIDNPAAVANQLLMENVFAGHPYAMDVEGNEDVLNRLQEKDLQNFRKQCLEAQPLKIVAIGNFDAKEMFSKLKKEFSSFRTQIKTPPKFPLSALKEDKNIFKQMDKEQSHIFIAYHGLTLDHKDRFVLKVLRAILSGQGGRLFMELRDKESLAYTVAPMDMSGIDAGYFGAYIACSPDKAEKAVKMLHAEFDKLCKEAIPQQELDRAIRYIIGKRDISMQKNSSIANAYLFDLLYGMGLSEETEFAKNIEAVTSEQVMKLAKEIFSKKCVRVLVGRKSAW